MQNKTSLRYISPEHAVYDIVRRQFEKDNRPLPPDWESLVSIGCFPSLADKEIRAFKENYAREPDLTLEVISVARDTLRRLTNPKSDKGKIFYHLLRNHTFIDEGKGKFRFLTPKDAGKKGLKIVRADSPNVTDKDMVELIFGSKAGNVENLKKIRQSLSYKLLEVEEPLKILSFTKKARVHLADPTRFAEFKLKYPVLVMDGESLRVPVAGDLHKDGLQFVAPDNLAADDESALRDVGIKVKVINYKVKRPVLPSPDFPQR